MKRYKVHFKSDQPEYSFWYSHGKDEEEAVRNIRKYSDNVEVVGVELVEVISDKEITY